MSIELALLPIAIAVMGALANRKQKRLEQEMTNSFSLPTRIKDARLLQTALQNCGCQSVSTGVTVDSEVQGARIVFEPTEHSGFNAVFVGGIPTDQAEDFLDSLYSEYTRQVQQAVYEKLKDRAAAKGMILESEELQDDDSVVLTFCVQDH